MLFNVMTKFHPRFHQRKKNFKSDEHVKISSFAFSDSL